MIFKPTTALRKIARLRSKIKGIQGGQGAGKTIAILMLLINHASSKEDSEIIIASEELTKMRFTVIKDFVKLMRDFELFEDHRWIAGTLYRFANNSFIKFIGLDKADVGKGFRCDVLFLNEGNKLPHETARQMISRAAITYIDFNPDEYFWYHTEYKDRNDCGHLQLNYSDNEYLPLNELHEILLYKEKGYNSDGSIKNAYWANKWQVYGLGNVGALDGVVFQEWSKYRDLPDDTEFYRLLGVDWGGNDPTTVIDVHIDEPGKRLFVREIIYQPQILNDKLIQIIQRNNPDDCFVVCDSSRKDKIYELQMSGIRALGATKGEGSVMDGIERLLQYQIFLHEDSKNLIFEFSNYKWIKDPRTERSLNEPEDTNNHGIDSLRYCLRFYKKSINPR